MKIRNASVTLVDEMIEPEYWNVGIPEDWKTGKERTVFTRALKFSSSILIIFKTQRQYSIIPTFQTIRVDEYHDSQTNITEALLKKNGLILSLYNQSSSP